MKKEDIDKLDKLIKTSEQVKYSKRTNLLLIFVGLMLSFFGFLAINSSRIPDDFLPIAAIMCVAGGLMAGYCASERSWESFIRLFPWLVLNVDALKSIRTFEDTGEMTEQSERLYALYKKLDEYFKNIR